MLKPIDPIETILGRIREEDTLAREADERHDVPAAESHNTVVAALLDRVRRMPLMSPAGVAAVLETAEALVSGSGADADDADLADAAELGQVASRFRAGQVCEADRAFLSHVSLSGGLGDHHIGAVSLIRAAARSACRPSFGQALAA